MLARLAGAGCLALQTEHAEFFPADRGALARRAVGFKVTTPGNNRWRQYRVLDLDLLERPRGKACRAW
jgi:hypothetical protein